MHVIERQPGVLQRREPGRTCQLIVLFQGLDGVGEIGFGALKLVAAGIQFVARKAFLQDRFGRALQRRIDGSAHHIRRRIERADAGNCLGFALHLIDEVEAYILPLPLIGHDLRHRRLGLFSGDDFVVSHPAEHVLEAVARAREVAVRVEIVRTLGKAGQHRALHRRQRACRFAEIAARRHLDAPGTTPEIDRVEIELENLGLAQRALDIRGDDDLAKLALIGDVVSDQQRLGQLLRDRRAALRPAGLPPDCR